MKESFRKHKWWYIVGVVVVLGALGNCGGGADTATTPPQATAPAATPAASAPEPAAEPEPGEGTSMADAAYKAAAPVVGEQVMTTDFESEEKFLMDRFMDAADANPDWAMQGLKVQLDGDTRKMPYEFADGSTFTFVAVPKGGQGDGLKLTEAIIER